jgi:deoxyribodipyrimidine photo-lyase
MTPAIMWFRRDLRIRDHAALTAAAADGRPVVPVYVSDSQDTGGASRWWLHYSLAELDSALQARGAGLLIREGKPEEELPGIARELGATDIYCNARPEPIARLQVDRLRDAVGENCTIHEYQDSTLQHPDSVMTLAGSPFKVFTPFWKAASGRGEPRAPLPAPDGFTTTHGELSSLPLPDLELLPRSPDWASGLRDTWVPGETGALERLEVSAELAPGYADERDRPDLDTTSRLSPHLHFGEVSPRQVWHDIASANPGNPGAQALLRQLYWREFSAYLLYHFPTLPEKPLREEFERFPWVDDADGLRAWQRGRTGYPIVDAGMRQLWSTGWMHNRVRMICASFLVKDLLIPWQNGADWFLDTLVDADLANNSASWQWVAGSGTDAAPYFRIFNPVLQGKKFDPLGDYVRQWVPELARMPTRYIHEPWLAPVDEQKRANALIGEDYPEPIVDHGKARETALTAYGAIRKTG